jgi:hypothetical protein
LFLTVVVINPARANNATDKITRVIRTSRRVKPFDCVEELMVAPQIQKPYWVSQNSRIRWDRA